MRLDGKPYTLDPDQAQAVLDCHKNTLVTARAGSGKTRVIVAKVAYLVARNLANLSEITAFMFNRAAAAEVNQRIGAVEIDGVSLRVHNHGQPIKLASTFHKFALEIVKHAGEPPKLTSETDHDALIRRLTRQVLAKQCLQLSPQQFDEYLRLISGFIARAGQKYPGAKGLTGLTTYVKSYIKLHSANAAYEPKIFLHRICLTVYQEYLLALTYPKIDFNVLMARATQILTEENHTSAITDHAPASRKHASARAARTRYAHKTIDNLKYILIDEYQDLSYLFFSLVQALRSHAPQTHLFCVGDDWQAINRFAGSDVDYFINFAQYFPEDVANIPLLTNYRSDRKIVENANRYMLQNYDSYATKAVPFSKRKGKIKYLSTTKTKFDPHDLSEDALGDARFQFALAKVCSGSPASYQAAAVLLKTVFKILKRHPQEEVLLLHRHNFTSFQNVTLENFTQALRLLCVQERLMTATDFDRQVRSMTMHKSKGLESDVVILLEANRDQLRASHPHATTFEIFGDTLEAEAADQHRLLYVALTRAKHQLYIVHSDKKCFL